MKVYVIFKFDVIFNDFFFRKVWFVIDLGVWIVLIYYILRYVRGYGR